jgi:hypothetical protein
MTTVYDFTELEQVAGGQTWACGLGTLAGALVGGAFGGIAGALGSFVGSMIFC